MTTKSAATTRKVRRSARTVAATPVASVTVTEARKRFSRLIDFVEQGNVVQVTRYGEPFLYLIPSKLYRRLRARDRARAKAAGQAPTSKP